MGHCSIHRNTDIALAHYPDIFTAQDWNSDIIVVWKIKSNSTTL
jgi:hypothetical protein